MTSPSNWAQKVIRLDSEEHSSTEAAIRSWQHALEVSEQLLGPRCHLAFFCLAKRVDSELDLLEKSPEQSLSSFLTTLTQLCSVTNLLLLFHTISESEGDARFDPAVRTALGRILNFITTSLSSKLVEKQRFLDALFELRVAFGESGKKTQPAPPPALTTEVEATSVSLKLSESGDVETISNQPPPTNNFAFFHGAISALKETFEIAGVQVSPQLQLSINFFSRAAGVLLAHGPKFFETQKLPYQKIDSLFSTLVESYLSLYSDLCECVENLTESIHQFMLSSAENPAEPAPVFCPFGGVAKRSCQHVLCGLDPWHSCAAFKNRCDACHKLEEEPRQFQTCGRCRQVFYCSKDCQRGHWKDHKTKCSSV